MTDLLSWLREALDEHERTANDVSRHGCDCMDVDCADSALREAVLRTVAAHREILDRHERMGNGDCDYCWRNPDASWPCADVRSLAAIYRDHPGFDPSWIGES